MSPRISLKVLMIVLCLNYYLKLGELEKY